MKSKASTPLLPATTGMQRPSVVVVVLDRLGRGTSTKDRLRTLFVLFGSLLALFWGFHLVQHHAARLYAPGKVRRDFTCAQPEALVPSPKANVSLDAVKDAKFQQDALQHFSSAVQIDTSIYDKAAGKGDNEKGIKKFHAFLEKTYPLIHSNLERHIINGKSLLFVWKGTNATNDRPLMLCAHQDVVPVLEDTVNLWTYPPWSGHIDDEFVWGRGAADTKASLIAIMESVETLLRGGFKPQRTVMLAFGHDEEISGLEGASKIASYIIENLELEGKVGMVVDEGSSIMDYMGAEMAFVSTGEKGYYDIKLTVRTPGGHSSMPPDHTSIGMLADAIVTLEANPHPATLPDSSPFVQLLTCAATHAPGVDSWLKFAIEHLDEFRPAVISALAERRESRALMTTTQAIDIIAGGHKVNALPEVVSVTVNHRVNVDSSAALLESRTLKLMLPVAAKHKLNVTLIPGDRTAPHKVVPVEGAVGTLEIAPFEPPLDPSPVSPTEGDAAYELLAGTIHHALGLKNPTAPLVVSPILMLGNTDTRHHWRLTKNIYRFVPFRSSGGSSGAHTVNEHMPKKSFLEGIGFYHELIRNYDERM
ncbi:hypothetical protein HDU96_004269 [Phlyctochytrium bullatum]|nr:hypothetical protein HDU96_004269 [Phlyctochytrium bullatum]